jgi:hypothetical protein
MRAKQKVIKNVRRKSAERRCHILCRFKAEVLVIDNSEGKVDKITSVGRKVST